VEERITSRAKGRQHKLYKSRHIASVLGASAQDAAHCRQW